MVVSKAITSGCATCRLSLIRSCTSSPIRRSIPTSGRFQTTTIPQRRIQSSSCLRQNDQYEDSGEKHPLEGPPISNETKEEFEEEAETAVSSVPWYLQVETSQKIPQTLSERQKIPELPESSPPILQPLLQQISVDLGLDNLTLLDLRKLDPPPALGANLIMLIGTARSEKHLHVSADRLCRWLRSNYKLRPSADGLLGRNELKLKLRRKSRRAKLMGNAGEDGEDDGIRTGWVCVDIGAVESPETETKVIPEGEGFVGFGRRTDGVRLVVQMLTEEKREEIDLEKLWGGILRRSGNPVVEDVEGDSQVPEPLSSVPLTSPPMPQRGFQIPQTRGFHTSTRTYSRGIGIQESMSGPSLEPRQNEGISENNSEKIEFQESMSGSSLEPQENEGLLESDTQDIEIQDSMSGSSLEPQTDEEFLEISLTDLPQLVRTKFASGDFVGALNITKKCKHIFPEDTDEWRKFMMLELKMYLANAPAETALSDLGKGAFDRNSTEFLKAFYKTRGEKLPYFSLESTIWLQCYARKLDHPDYRLNGLRRSVEKYADGMKVAPEYLLVLLRSILKPVVVERKYVHPRKSLELAFELITEMSKKNIQLFTEDMFVTLLVATEPVEEIEESTVIPTFVANDSFDLPTRAMTPIQRRIHLLMLYLNLPLFSDESRMRLMDMYARNENWIAFWDIWRSALQRNQPQSVAMYTFMFRKVAESRHQRGCIKALRTWMENLELEDPPIELEGELAQAVMECLLVADPFVEQEAADPNREVGEWVLLWRRCQAGMMLEQGEQGMLNNGANHDDMMERGAHYAGLDEERTL